MENKTVFWVLVAFTWLFAITSVITGDNNAFIGTMIFAAAGLIVLNNNLRTKSGS